MAFPFFVEIPNPPDPPFAELLNKTSLNVTWNFPSYPVNWYNLIFSKYAGEQNSQENYTTTKTFFILNNEQGFECDKLSLSLQASTDVGLTEVSNSTIKKFYKGSELKQMSCQLIAYIYSGCAKCVLLF